MKNIVSNLQEHLSKGKHQNLEFLNDLYNKMKNDGTDVLDYQHLKAQSVSPQCPNCHSIHIKKNGHQQGQQMYKCKDCGKNFRETTGTFVYYLHKKELMLDYIRLMLEGKTLRQCSKELGISLPTSFEWRHRILSALRSFENNVNFFGIMEIDELLMQYSEKGRRYKTIEEYLLAQELKKHKVAILSMIDRSGNMLCKLTGLDNVKREQIEKIVSMRISKNAVICSPDNEEFKNISENKLKDKTVITNRKKKYGQHGLAIVKDKENDFVGWINDTFRGVATKYLQSYIMWYVVKHKYLLSRVIDDIGRMLNLAASDWEAWYVYMRLRLKPRESLT
jgi:transposase-like protein